jgi:crotonobetainyl-CoA:carnitine CoA-transferase CaiB-like acyl-CoA transferase
MVASPLNVSGASRNIRSTTPEPGEHTDEVLRAAGYSGETIEKLRASGVI